MSSRRFRPVLARIRTSLPTALLLALIPAAGFAAGAQWAPIDIAAESLQSQATLHYDGLSGRLVRAEKNLSTELETLGASTVEFSSFDNLYIFLVEDAAIAEFEAPARVLLRSGREVLVETEGLDPHLTEAAGAALSGFRQPIRLSAKPMPWPDDVAVDDPGQAREHNPVIQGMVDALTETSYMANWQPLEDFVNRYTFAAQNEQATQWILDQFISYGLDAEFHHYNQSGQRRNVVATLPGLIYPDKVIYIGGHMDATSSNTNSCAPGADDDGSGTAAVLEAARILSQYSFEHTIKFITFNGEEQGLVGSAAYCADIASAGEDVIGAFTMDMIAYRGNDPAPPDLVMYTNNQSLFLANAVSDACDTYLAGELEPIIHIENLTASDHASFWSNGYAAIVASEDEAWGSDFNPWYHSCDDMIFRYPTDYVTWCAKAQVAAVAATAVPLNPDGSFLIVADVTTDDDDTPPSAGDGDGALNPGETIELWVNLENIGTAAATDVAGQLSSSSGSISIGTDSASWNDIAQTGSGSNLTPFVFTVAGTALDGESVGFTLEMTSNGAPQELSINFGVVAPDLAFYHHGLNDPAPGNGNGVVDPGERLYIPVELSNHGGRSAVAVGAQLTSGSAAISVLEDAGSAALIVAGGTAELAPAYRVEIGSGALEGEIIPMDLAISTATGYEGSSAFNLKVGSHFYDELESAGAWTLGVAGDDASTGVWERVDPVGTDDSGDPVAPENDYTAAPGTHCFVTGQGQPGGSIGANDVDGGTTTLLSPSFDIANVNEPRVTYYRWFTNNSGSSPNEDEWVVQVSANGGGGWVDLERTNVTVNSWEERSFLLTDYITPSADVVFRFLAEDNGSGSIVEAGVDNFEVSGLMEPVETASADFPGTPLRLALSQGQPNPFRDQTRIAFALPKAAQASLKLFSVDGRLVRTLLDGEATVGRHEIVWDGLDEKGKSVAPGVYAYRLSVDGQERTRKLVRLQ